jgi:beta-ribofuranosylaminobenzene 5'-phosphate synthase
MNDDGYRINGGVGFSISEPAIICCFKKSFDIEIIDERKRTFAVDEIERLKKTIEECRITYKLKSSIKCTIFGDSLPHYGLGSNTTIYLSCMEAILLLNGHKYDNKLLVDLSKRGGTSGIGINTYFDGGFVFDLGIKTEKKLLHPSSIANRDGIIPSVLYKGNSPDWSIGLCIPKQIENKSEEEEIDFFKNNCPIDKFLVQEILYESTYGIASSIIEEDYKTFCKAVNKIQTTQWKLLERSIYGNKLIEIEDALKELGADCVGMSSLGPGLFFTGKNIEEIISVLTLTFPSVECYCTTMNNQGRIITYD